MVGDGTDTPEGGGDICIHIADPLCCAAESNATCKTAIPQLKNFFFKKKTQFAIMVLIGHHWAW